MDSIVKHHVLDVEEFNDVRAVFVCERGDRASGSDSDESIREIGMIYASRPEWYVSVDPKPETIHSGSKQDRCAIHGVDVRRALTLIRGSDATIMEWMGDQDAYIMMTAAMEGIVGKAMGLYHPKRCFDHYLREAESNRKRHLGHQEMEPVKYLKVIHPLLKCLWTAKGYGPAPSCFEKLMDAVVDDIRVKNAISDVIHLKKTGGGLEKAPKNGLLSVYIDKTIDRMDVPDFGERGPTEPLDRLFHDILFETYGADWSPRR